MLHLPVCYLLRLLVLTVQCNIHEIKMNISAKERYYFAFIIHQVNKHGVFKMRFTEADVKDFKRGALGTTRDIAKTGLELS